MEEIGSYKKKCVSCVEIVVLTRLQRCECTHKDFRNNFSKPQLIQSMKILFCGKELLQRLPYSTLLQIQFSAFRHVLIKRRPSPKKTQTCSCCGGEIKINDLMRREGDIEQLLIKIKNQLAQDTKWFYVYSKECKLKYERISTFQIARLNIVSTKVLWYSQRSNIY